MNSPELRTMSRTLTFILSLAVGFAMILQNPDLAPFVPEGLPTLAIMYGAMVLLGAAAVASWSSLSQLLLGFVGCMLVASLIFSFGTGWALVATGMPMDIISGWVLRPLFGYLTVLIPLAGAGAIVVGLWVN